MKHWYISLSLALFLFVNCSTRQDRNIPDIEAVESSLNYLKADDELANLIGHYKGYEFDENSQFILKDSIATVQLTYRGSKGEVEAKIELIAKAKEWKVKDVFFDKTTLEFK